MTLLFSLITITSIWCIGLTVITQPQMLLYFVREWADVKYEKGNKWVEAAIRCHWCMGSAHSLFGYAFAVGMGLIKSFSWHLVFMWPLVICGASLCNGLVWGLATLMMEKTVYYKNINEPNLEGEEEQEITEHYLH